MARIGAGLFAVAALSLFLSCLRFTPVLFLNPSRYEVRYTFTRADKYSRFLSPCIMYYTVFVFILYLFLYFPPSPRPRKTGA